LLPWSWPAQSRTPPFFSTLSNIGNDYIVTNVATPAVQLSQLGLVATLVALLALRRKAGVRAALTGVAAGGCVQLAAVYAVSSKVGTFSFFDAAKIQVTIIAVCGTLRLGRGEPFSLQRRRPSPKSYTHRVPRLLLACVYVYLCLCLCLSMSYTASVVALTPARPSVGAPIAPVLKQALLALLTLSAFVAAYGLYDLDAWMALEFKGAAADKLRSVAARAALVVGLGVQLRDAIMYGSIVRDADRTTGAVVGLVSLVQLVLGYDAATKARTAMGVSVSETVRALRCGRRVLFGRCVFLCLRRLLNAFLARLVCFTVQSLWIVTIFAAVILAGLYENSFSLRASSSASSAASAAKAATPAKSPAPAAPAADKRQSPARSVSPAKVAKAATPAKKAASPAKKAASPAKKAASPAKKSAAKSPAKVRLQRGLCSLCAALVLLYVVVFGYWVVVLLCLHFCSLSHVHRLQTRAGVACEEVRTASAVQIVSCGWRLLFSKCDRFHSSLTRTHIHKNLSLCLLHAC
jgi:hypothetical protein